MSVMDVLVLPVQRAYTVPVGRCEHRIGGPHSLRCVLASHAGSGHVYVSTLGDNEESGEG